MLDSFIFLKYHSLSYNCIRWGSPTTPENKVRLMSLHRIIKGAWESQRRHRKSEEVIYWAVNAKKGRRGLVNMLELLAIGTGMFLIRFMPGLAVPLHVSRVSIADVLGVNFDGQARILGAKGGRRLDRLLRSPYPYFIELRVYNEHAAARLCSPWGQRGGRRETHFHYATRHPYASSAIDIGW